MVLIPGVMAIVSKNLPSLLTKTLTLLITTVASVSVLPTMFTRGWVLIISSLGDSITSSGALCKVRYCNPKYDKNSTITIPVITMRNRRGVKRYGVGIKCLFI